MFKLKAAKSSDKGSSVSYPPLRVFRLQVAREKLFTCDLNLKTELKITVQNEWKLCIW